MKAVLDIGLHPLRHQQRYYSKSYLEKIMSGWRAVEIRRGFEIFDVPNPPSNMTVPVVLVRCPKHGLVHYFTTAAVAVEFADEGFKAISGEV